MTKQTCIASDIYIATILSTVIYNVENTKHWSEKSTYFDRGILYTKSVYLKRNLIGKEGLLDIGYYISDDTLFLVYSGTEALEFWLYNTDTDTKIHNGINFHEGFLNLAKEVSKALTHEDFVNKLIKDNNIRRVVHCGHSTGGAIAGIMPVLISKGQTDHLIIDYGTPKYLSDQPLGFRYPFYRLRFQEIWDIVPCIPLTWRGPLPGFHNFGEVKYINSFRYVKKLPWYRSFVFFIKYIRSIYKRGVIDEAISHHRMGNYASVIISNPSYQ